MANMNKKRAKKLNEEYVEPEIITISDICGGKIVKNLEDNNFLTLNVRTSDDDIYAVAIPGVLFHKIEKEVSEDGESGAGRSGIQEATEVEAGGSEQQEDQTGGEGEDEKTEVE